MNIPENKNYVLLLAAVMWSTVLNSWNNHFVFELIRFNFCLQLIR